MFSFLLFFCLIFVYLHAYLYVLAVVGHGSKAPVGFDRPAAYFSVSQIWNETYYYYTHCARLADKDTRCSFHDGPELLGNVTGSVGIT